MGHPAKVKLTLRCVGETPTRQPAGTPALLESKATNCGVSSLTMGGESPSIAGQREMLARGTVCAGEAQPPSSQTTLVPGDAA
jgi:hypothetical protein